MKKQKIDYSKLPVYKMTVNENDLETGVQLISIVDKPAIEVYGIALAPQDFDVVLPPCHQTWDGTDNCQCDIIDGVWYTGDNPCEFCLENKAAWDALNFQFSKHKFNADNEQKIIVGPALIPDKKIFRSGKENGMGPHLIYFTAEDIRTLVKKFNRGNNNRSIDVMHDGTTVNAYIMENWLVADPVYDKSKLYGYSLPKDSWFITMKIDDDNFWNKEVKELGINSFSVEANLGQQLMKFALVNTENEQNLVNKLSVDGVIEYYSHALKIIR